MLNWRKLGPEPDAEFEEPIHDAEDLLGLVSKDLRAPFDMREVIARVVDGSYFHEYQPDYGTTLICGYAYIWGYKVGILANNGVLFNDSSLKGAHFIFDFCTVGGTEHIMMAATLATGKTVLENCAKEPEIIDLAECLNAMGAQITGQGTDTITINGVKSMHGCTHR